MDWRNDKIILNYIKMKKCLYMDVASIADSVNSKH